MTEIHDAAAAYALDALDAAEQVEFELHLQTCADCRAEVAELRETAAGLVLTGTTPPPPPDLRAAVLAGVVGVEQLPPTPGRPRRALPSAEPEEPEVAPLTVAAVGAQIDELALRRANRRARLLSGLVAAVTVVALALGGVVYSLARQSEAPPVAAPPVVQAPQVDPSLLAAPDAEIVQAEVSGVDAAFVVSKSQNRAVFVSIDLPNPGQGNLYHLWTLKGDTIVRPDNTFNVADQGTQSFSGPIDDSTALAINVEPAGTSPDAPTSTPLAIAKI